MKVACFFTGHGDLPVSEVVVSTSRDARQHLHLGGKSAGSIGEIHDLNDPVCLSVADAQPVVIVSDLHLGHPATLIDDPRDLASLWQGARTVIFNGDTVDTGPHVPHREVSRLLGRLVRSVEKAGATPIFTAGNHDPELVSTRAVELCHGQVLVTHGDCLHPAIAPWSGESAIARQAFDMSFIMLSEVAQLQGENGPDSMELWLRASQAAAREVLARMDRYSHASAGPGAKLRHIGRFLFAPQRVMRILKYWRELPYRAADFLDQHRPDAGFIIIGHSHKPGTWKVDDKVIVNTGAFQPLGKPSVVRIDRDILAFSDLLHDKDGWHIGTPAAVTFDLPARTTTRWEKAA
ncbi:MAG TPA: hypothetical protein ENJ06_04600 [Phycisphaeraceae bacterium]|nr:hypothetical protein [Phycisphaeraceae bacterium]